MLLKNILRPRLGGSKFKVHGSAMPASRLKRIDKDFRNVYQFTVAGAGDPPGVLSGRDRGLTVP